MGWYHVATDSDHGPKRVWVDREGRRFKELPAFSRDIGTAWRILEAIKKHSPESGTRFLAEIPSLAEIIDNPPEYAALMICRAALLAVEP
jgi:hypothetical protein